MGTLQRVMATSMFTDDAPRKRFEKACKKPDPKPLAAWTKAFGWAPPKELAEWEGVKSGYRKVFMEVSDVWMIGGTLTFKPVPIEKMLTADGVITLLTGLVHFGDDPSGDRCFVSTLPSPDGLAHIHVYDHETGELGSDYKSIAQFVLENWNESAKADRAKTKKLPVEQDPRALFERMKWLWGLPLGEPMYGFAEDISKAPDFSTWEKEKKLFKQNPVLANYWMLAHYFLGNDTACAEAVELGKKAAGTLTPAIAKLFGALLAKPASAKLAKLSPKKLLELRAATRKNADEKLLEPAQRGEVKKARAIAGPSADEILAALLKEDRSLKETVERFQKQRTEETYDQWPDKYDLRDGPLDRRISPAVAAAFRAGLKFDADHKKAASSFVHTLAYFDDDNAMDAFAEAIEACKMNDDRVEYLVGAVRRSKHPRALGILARAAWRFFEFFDATKESMAKQAKRGPTLDDVFRVHSHLLVALIWRIRTGDDESEKLVDKVCSIVSNMTVLGAAFSAAFQQVGNKKLERHKGYVTNYVNGVLSLQGEHLTDDTMYNLAEAALALAKLDPELFREVMPPVPDGTAPAKQMRLDKMGSVLAALLYLTPDDPEVLRWTERILGNRTGADRVYGALRGVAEGKVAAAKPWLGWHLYHGTSSNHIGDKPMIMRAASAALVALGEPEPPPFDESDEFAHERKDAELPDALRDRGRHLLDWTFKLVVERKLRSPEIVEVASEILHDNYRFSADDEPRHSDNERVEGLKCMLYQGPSALPALASLLELPKMAGGDKTVVICVMSILADGPEMFARLATATPDELLAALTPTPENIGNLDLAAGFAFATLGDNARTAIEAAYAWRTSKLDPEEHDHWLEQEPIASGLAYLTGRMNAKQPLDGMDGQASRTFQQKLRGPTYTCRIDVDGAKIALSLAGTDIYVRGILDGNKYEQTASIQASAPEAAVEIADRIARGLCAIGFAPVAPPTAKKAKKK